MEIRQVCIDDLPEINNWYTKRGLTGLIPEVLPEAGFIVPRVAAAFLYATDGGIGFLESYIGNPEAPKEKVRDALKQITEHLISCARNAGLKVVIGFCIKGTLPFAEYAKAKILGEYTLAALEIK